MFGYIKDDQDVGSWRLCGSIDSLGYLIFKELAILMISSWKLLLRGVSVSVCVLWLVTFKYEVIEVEMELGRLQCMIRGEQNSIYHSIWSMGEEITTLSFFSQIGQEYMPICDHDSEASNPVTNRQKVTSS